MLKRIMYYLNEMFPPLSRFGVAFIVFAELYFIVLLNNGVTTFNFGWQELIGICTVFAFLLLLRIADDFKDYETDCKLFPKRPLPSGKVKKKDLWILLATVEIPIIIVNLLFMNNVPFFLFLYFYGFLMCIWFFQKSKIQPNLVLACITHNPVQMIINIYVISFVCTKYNLDWKSLPVITAAFTMYFPGLIWEISRKIRAPKDETKYVTYSKLFGYKKATRFVGGVILLDVITNIILVWNLNKLAIIPLLLDVAWVMYNIHAFNKKPTKFKFVDRIVAYDTIQEIIMLLTVVGYLSFGAIL